MEWKILVGEGGLWPEAVKEDKDRSGLVAPNLDRTFSHRQVREREHAFPPSFSDDLLGDKMTRVHKVGSDGEWDGREDARYRSTSIKGRMSIDI